MRAGASTCLFHEYHGAVVRLRGCAVAADLGHACCRRGEREVPTARVAQHIAALASGIYCQDLDPVCTRGFRGAEMP